MDNISVTLKTITPMFLAGADGKTPELRAPSIKGMMRFWWRAMNGHLSIEELRKKEGMLFGSSDEKIGSSSFSLRIFDIQPDNNKQGISLTPHHDDEYCSSTDASKVCNYRNEKCMKAIKREGYFLGKFTIRVTSRASDKAASIENILKITTILGGFGKRSRRGFGSVEITQIDGKPNPCGNTLDSLIASLNIIAPDTFSLSNGKITKTIVHPAHQEAGYPYIKEIEIGKKQDSWKNLLGKIGRASHDHDCYYTGFVSPYRFASPISVSLIQGDKDSYLPIVTTLNCAFKPGSNLFDKDKKKDKSSDFKEAVLC